jgi:hypothetical protein
MQVATMARRSYPMAVGGCSMSKPKKLAATLAIAVAACVAPHAGASAHVSSRTFLADCIQPVDAVQRAECRGYILAVADAINSNIVKGRRVCLPAGLDQDDVREDVTRWIRENARVVQRMHGFGAAYAALIKTYPCGKR